MFGHSTRSSRTNPDLSKSTPLKQGEICKKTNQKNLPFGSSVSSTPSPENSPEKENKNFNPIIGNIPLYPDKIIQTNISDEMKTINNDSVIFIGKIIYFSKKQSHFEMEYTKLILERKEGSITSYFVINIINKQNKSSIFDLSDNYKNKIISIKVRKSLFDNKGSNLTDNNFSDQIMSPITRSLKNKIKNAYNYTFDVTQYKSKYRAISAQLILPDNTEIKKKERKKKN